MNTDLLDQLESKINLTLENLEMLRLELDEVREENRQLLAEREQNYSRLSAIVGQLSTAEKESQPFATAE